MLLRNLYVVYKIEKTLQSHLSSFPVYWIIFHKTISPRHALVIAMVWIADERANTDITSASECKKGSGSISRGFPGQAGFFKLIQKFLPLKSYIYRPVGFQCQIPTLNQESVPQTWHYWTQSNPDIGTSAI